MDISPKLVTELKDALQAVGSYGSVEVFVQNNEITQITVRNIKKTSNKDFWVNKKNGNGITA